jgi:hypothetical protein
LLVDETLLDFAFLEVSSAAVLVLDEDRALDEIPPSEDLLGPEFERVQKDQILTVSESHLRFAEADETLDRKIVIVETRITNAVIDPIHLQFDFVTYRNLT